MQSRYCEMLGWMSHKLESILPGEISTTSDMQMLGNYYKTDYLAVLSPGKKKKKKRLLQNRAPILPSGVDLR